MRTVDSELHAFADSQVIISFYRVAEREGDIIVTSHAALWANVLRDIQTGH